MNSSRTVNNSTPIRSFRSGEIAADAVGRVSTPDSAQAPPRDARWRSIVRRDCISNLFIIVATLSKCPPRIVQTLFRFFHRCTFALILVFGDTAERPFVVPDHRQDLFNGRVTLTPLEIRAAVSALLSILEMDMGDLVVHLSQGGDSVEIRRREM